jgi:hypothetical protein
MRRAWIAVIAVAALTVPAAAFAHDDDGQPSPRKNASKVCKALRAELGKDLFRQAYGTNHNRRNAHGKCVSGHRFGVRKLVAQAVAECKQEAGATMKHRHFGEGGKSPAERQAFRECVRAKVAQLLAERRAAVEAAVKSCQDERAAGVEAFREKYGVGEHNRHAFFRCVVQTFRANQEAAQQA